MFMVSFMLSSYMFFSYMLDNYVTSFVNGINPGFPLRARCILIGYELSRQIRFPVPLVDMLQRCIYLVYK